MKSSAVLSRSAPASPSINRAITSASAASSIPAASAQPCQAGLEQYCDNGMTGTYGGIDKVIGEPTNGGYSNKIVVDENYVLRIPENLDLAAAAPLLCAGITLYSPLRHWKAGPGKKVGIIGLGGLGHMGVKLAHAMGAHTVLFTTSPGQGGRRASASAPSEVMHLKGRRRRWQPMPAAST